MSYSAYLNNISISKKIIYSLLTILLFFHTNSGISQTISIFRHEFLPPTFIVVDKEKQILYLIKSQNENLKILKREPCSTGANKGEKFIQGDEKTPEGIYFITKRITRPLDPILYGNLAFSLNYPNPIDRLFNKNGGGIWLHGRGKKLVPYDTRGCIALKNPSIEELKNHLVFNITPIIIGDKIDFIKPTDIWNNEIKKIKNTIINWITTWKNKEDVFFDFYDKIAFSKTQKIEFEDFIKQKKYYFKRYKWIDIYVSKIYILTGAYYTVSYFYEFFRSPKYQSTGIKRLYFMKKKDEYKIVASEWIPTNINLINDYIKYHTSKIYDFLKKWKQAWENKDIKSYISFYDANAKQNKLIGINNILAFKQKLWQNLEYVNVTLKDINISLVQEGFKIEYIQSYKSNIHNDFGKKTLIIYPYKNSYKIEKEIWEPL